MKQCMSMIEAKMIWKNKKIRRVIVNGVKVLAGFFFFLIFSLFLLFQDCLEGMISMCDIYTESSSVLTER